MSILTRCLLAAPLAISACVHGPEPVAPEIEMPDAWLSDVPTSSESPALGPWWSAFDDPVLDALMREVMANNLDVRQALANVDVARAQGRAVRSDLFPTLDGFVEAGLDTVLSGGVGADADGAVGANLGFDRDINGRTRRSLEAAEARLATAELTRADVQRLVTRDAALQYIELRRAGARLALLETTLDLQSRTLEIVEARFRAGLSPALDVDRSAADLARTRAQRGLLLASRQTAGYNLALLSGSAPQAEGYGSAASDEVPFYDRSIELGVPADLVRRRPDIRAAEARLIAEIATIGVEEADLYPSLSLPGQIRASGGTAGSSVDRVTLGLSALLDVPILDFGRRRAEVEAQRARAQASLLAWQQSVLVALTEVESALVQIEALRDRLAELERSVEASESAYRQLDALYREGLASFIDVLDAQRTLISGRESVIETRADLASAFVALEAALSAPSGS